ncbi:MAG: ABC transporter ATP-binding protein/permease [Planctomycetes bacterium]|nr:ABC transporter ATP-binding protein/permease [Planctomycetota bacterium]
MIRISSGTKRFRGPKGEFTVLENVSLELSAGEVLGIIGKNGAGKTTLLKILSGVTLMDEGVLEFPQGFAPRVALASEEGRGFWQRLTGGQNIEFFAAISGLNAAETRKRLAELEPALELAEIGVKRYSTFSPGLRQRLAIARAIIAEPDVILLDEPTRSLDPEWTERVLELTANFARNGKAILFVSHRPGEVQRLANKIGIIEGRRFLGLRSEDVSSEKRVIFKKRIEDRGSRIEGMESKSEGETLFAILGNLEIESRELSRDTVEATCSAEKWRELQRSLPAEDADVCEVSDVIDDFERLAAKSEGSVSSEQGADQKSEVRSQRSEVENEKLAPRTSHLAHRRSTITSIFLALLKVDIYTALSYRFIAVLSGLWMLGLLFAAFLFSGVVKSEFVGGMRFFDFLIIGFVFYTLPRVCFSMPSSFVRRMQIEGILDTIVASGVSFRKLLVAIIAEKFLASAVESGFWFLVAVIVFGLDFSSVNPLLLLASIFTALPAFLGIGLAGVGLTLVFKKTESLIIFAASVLAIGSGLVIPLSAFPSWLQKIAWWLPYRPYLDSVRASFSEGATLEAARTDLTYLLILGAATLPLGLAVSRWGERTAKKQGTLSQF